MNDINKKLDAYERRQLIKRLPPALLTVLVVTIGLYFVSKGEPTKGKEVEALITSSLITFSELGNEVKLKIQTEQGFSYVALPKGTRLKKSGKVLVYERKVASGRIKYKFMRYIE